MEFGDDVPGFNKPGNTGLDGGDRDRVRFRRGISSGRHQACAAVDLVLNQVEQKTCRSRYVDINQVSK